MADKKYLNIAGYWREARTLDDVIFELCPECGHPLEWSTWIWATGGSDYQLEQAWEKEWEPAFECDDVCTTCEHCGE